MAIGLPTTMDLNLAEYYPGGTATSSTPYEPPKYTSLARFYALNYLILASAATLAALIVNQLIVWF